MKKLLIFAFVAVLCLVMAACDLNDGSDTTATTTATTTTAATTTVVTTTAAPEEVLGEISEPENFDNVTLKMAGTVDGDAFDYDFYFADGKCLMVDNDNESNYTELYEGEDATMVRSIFVDTALALLAHGDQFALTSDGYRCNDAITYECDVLGAGHATIVSTNNLVALNDSGDLLSLSCTMLQSCEGDSVDVVVTFTFTDYGTTVIAAAAE